MPKRKDRPRLNWHQKSLKEHWDKRKGEGRCWIDLIGKPDPDKDDYRTRARSVAKDPWLAFEAIKEVRDKKTGRATRHPKSDYYIDAALVTVIAKLRRNDIVTCYHKHFMHADHNVVLGWSAAERIREFEKWRDLKIDAKVFTEYKKIEYED